MSTDPGLVAVAIDSQPMLWVLAVVLYGVGDTVTTLLGLRTDGTTEGGPVAAYAIERGGTSGFLLLKAVFVGAFFLVWSLLSTPTRVAIPLALVVVGAAVTCWNLLVVFS